LQCDLCLGYQKENKVHDRRICDECEARAAHSNIADSHINTLHKAIRDSLRALDLQEYGYVRGVLNVVLNQTGDNK